MPFKADIQALCDRMAAAYVSGDAAGCAAGFTEDAVLLSPYAAAARSRAAIEALHRVWTAGGGGKKSFDVIEAQADGDFGWCLIAFAEGDVTGAGKTLAIVRRQPDGAWLIHRASLCADIPPLA